jgi:fumarate reductase flavoprotein subunit
LQIPPATLLESMRAHWLELGRDPDQISGPFYALGPVRGYITITEGGLAVNDKLQVLDRNDHPVPGLWACGSAGQGGVLLDGHGHHLAWAFVSGRHVGQQLASR